MENRNISRKEALPGFLIVVIGAIALYFLMEMTRPNPEGSTAIYSFIDLAMGCAEGSLLYKFFWLLSDYTEGTFLASAIATVCMIPVGLIAAHLENKHSRYAGTGVDGNGKRFVKALCSSIIAVILTIAIYGRSEWYGTYFFIPTFSAILMTMAMAFSYGTEIKKLITIIVISTLIPFPICLALMVYVTMPIGLPGFISVSLGLLIAVPLCHQIVKRMPWMMAPDPETPVSENTQEAEDKAQSPTWFFIHRVFGDVGELVLFGSSWAAMAMYVGVIISWYLNPLHPVYAGLNLPMMILSQLLTAALSVFLYYPTWKRDGWAFTFAGIVFTSAIVNTYSNSWAVVIPTIIIGAIVFPVLVPKILGIFKFNGSYPALGLIQLNISLICIPWSLLVLHILMPLIGA